jgi:hypothetical protein
MGDAGSAPMVEALAVNHHLRELNLKWNDMSEVFASAAAAGGARKHVRRSRSDQQRVAARAHMLI